MTPAEPVMTLVDAYAAATFFGVAPATVRQWARRYGVQARGREKRRALYALEDLMDLTPGGK